MNIVNGLSRTLAPFMRENAIDPPDGDPGAYTKSAALESSAAKVPRKQIDFENKILKSLQMAELTDITINPKVIPSPCHAVTCGLHSVNSAEVFPVFRFRWLLLPGFRFRSRRTTSSQTTR
jgi:hypothetical protein